MPSYFKYVQYLGFGLFAFGGIFVILPTTTTKSSRRSTEHKDKSRQRDLAPAVGTHTSRQGPPSPREQPAAQLGSRILTPPSSQHPSHPRSQVPLCISCHQPSSSFLNSTEIPLTSNPYKTPLLIGVVTLNFQ